MLTKCDSCGKIIKRNPTRIRKCKRFWCSDCSPKHSITPEMRFFKAVQKTDGCWHWKAGKDKHGYGLIKVDGLRVFAHRFSYELHKGEIPAGNGVFHHCDQPDCVKPDHLFTGIAADNVADAVSKGRTAKGNKLPQSKLDPDKVKQIRIIRLNGMVMEKIAEIFGVSRRTIGAVVDGKSWKHV